MVRRNDLGVCFDSSRRRRIFHACVHAGALCSLPLWYNSVWARATPQAATIPLLAQGPRQLGAIFAACFTLVCCTPKPRVKMASASSNMLYPSTARSCSRSLLSRAALLVNLWQKKRLAAKIAELRVEAAPPMRGGGWCHTSLSRKLYLSNIRAVIILLMVAIDQMAKYFCSSLNSNSKITNDICNNEMLWILN